MSKYIKTLKQFGSASDIYILIYESGKEDEAIKAVMEWEENPKLNFGCFEAQILIRQINQTREMPHSIDLLF